MERHLHAVEVKQDVTDDCFVNLWFIQDWDGDTIIRFLESYQTEYCGQVKALKHSYIFCPEKL
jgi:hypothetical protein